MILFLFRYQTRIQRQNVLVYYHYHYQAYTNFSSNLNSLLMGIPTNKRNKFSIADLCLFNPLIGLKPGLDNGAFNQ